MNNEKEETKHISISIGKSVFMIMKQRKNRMRKYLGYDRLSWCDYFKLISLCFREETCIKR